MRVKLCLSGVRVCLPRLGFLPGHLGRRNYPAATVIFLVLACFNLQWPNLIFAVA
jgi:hypothetical protein